MNDKLKDAQVHFIVETQLLLRPYLIGRCRMHLLYKICRAENPDALHADFRATGETEERPFHKYQEDARTSMRARLEGTDDVNLQHKDLKGATLLWKAAEQGHIEVVRELLQNESIDPNKVRDGTCTTPLYIAAYRGHEEVVKALVGHPDIEVNLGKVDAAVSPLAAAAQEGREGVVKVLLQCVGVNVNDVTKREGATPLCKACQRGHEHIVEILLRCPDIDTTHVLQDGATALSIAGSHGHVKIVETITARVREEDPNAMLTFPKRGHFDSDERYHEAALSWARGVGHARDVLPAQVRQAVHAAPVITPGRLSPSNNC